MGLDYSGMLKALPGAFGFFLSIGWPLLLLAAGRVAWEVWQRRRLAAAGIGDIDAMDGCTFEKRLGVLFADLGYAVERTPYQRDWGADLVLRRAGVKTVVQAKRYKKAVGVRAVQEAVAAKAKYGCTEAMVVTNSRFTRAAEELARVNGVVLWDRHRLIRALTEARPAPQPAAPVSAPAAAPLPAPLIPADVCALCGTPLSPRVAAYCREHAGRFAGGLYCFPHQRVFDPSSPARLSRR
jgi:restriction system protein